MESAASQDAVQISAYLLITTWWRLPSGTYPKEGTVWIIYRAGLQHSGYSLLRHMHCNRASICTLQCPTNLWNICDGWKSFLYQACVKILNKKQSWQVPGSVSDQDRRCEWSTLYQPPLAKECVIRRVIRRVMHADVAVDAFYLNPEVSHHCSLFVLKGKLRSTFFTPRSKPFCSIVLIKFLRWRNLF